MLDAAKWQKRSPFANQKTKKTEFEAVASQEKVKRKKVVVAHFHLISGSLSETVVAAAAGSEAESTAPVVAPAAGAEK